MFLRPIIVELLSTNTNMLAKIFSAALVGLDAVPVEVEVDIASQGLPSFTIVGLPDKAVEEAKERVRSAIRNTGADFPARRITVNLAPADLPKEGPSYDLPIALGILLASGQLKADLETALVAGELSLDGRIRPVSGTLPQAIMARTLNFTSLFLSSENAREATIIPGLKIFSFPTLLSLFNHLNGTSPGSPLAETSLDDYFLKEDFEFDMKDIKGQHQAKRALEIAASGGHNLLMKGPPGAGKTLLARTLPSILPLLTFEEAIEVTKIYSITNTLSGKTVITTRPFRAPHHSTSLVGLIGGSSNPRPGEISLAHRGVLFLDELPEFSKHILETLRQPLEDGIVNISRATNKVTFPAKFMLIAAQNPCPCGYYGDTSHECSCTTSQIQRYQKKLSGPLLDRIDLHLTVPAIKVEKLTNQNDENAESSQVIRERVQKARDRQTSRFYQTAVMTNSEMTNKQVKEYCQLTKEGLSLMRRAVETMKLSGRAYQRTLKVARTIADLADSQEIMVEHLAEALQYRQRENAF